MDTGESVAGPTLNDKERITLHLPTSQLRLGPALSTTRTPSLPDINPTNARQTTDRVDRTGGPPSSRLTPPHEKLQRLV
ncbi:hypothetical protein BJV77DRAFT_1055339 [Russula vinacea]|nr:hypothetical protein BJV77DRAFT_1055339 [Russula vinacea]